MPVLLFNFNEVSPTENCELIDANTRVEPKVEPFQKIGDLGTKLKLFFLRNFKY